MSLMSSRGDLTPFTELRFEPHRQNAFAAGDLLDLRQLWTIVLSRGRLFAAVAGLFVLLAVSYLLLVPPTYTATSVILADPRQERILTSEAVLSGIGADAAAVESQVELIRSTALVSKVVDKLNLMADPEFTQPSILGAVIDAIAPGGMQADSETEALLQRNKVIGLFREKMLVRRRGLTYILEVDFDSKDAAKAARIANTIADVYLNDQVEVRSDATSSASRWLDQRIASMRTKVRDADRALAQFKADNNVIDLGGTNSGLTLIKRQIEQINNQLILARARAAETEAKFKQVKRITDGGIDPGSLPAALNSDVIAKLRVAYSAVARVEADLSTTYGPGHPNLIRIRSQLSKMREQIKKEMERIVVGARNQYETSRNRVASLARSLQELEDKSAGVNTVAVRQAELEREAQANRTLFEQLLSRSKETHEQSSRQRSDARIVAHAIRPVEPSHPRVLIVLLIASVGGLAAGVGSTLVAHNLDASYRSRRALEADLGVPCLAVWPFVSPSELGMGSRSRSLLMSWFGGARYRSGASAGDDATYRQLLGLVSMDQPGSQFADAVRTTRLACVAACQSPAPKVILMSSTLPGEGKSTIAANLARSLARTGANTLLIDADSRDASLTGLFCQPDTAGLSEVLGGKMTLKSASVYEEESGLFFLPAGQDRLDLDETDLLAGDRLANFLSYYREAFDHIVIDAPPVLSMADGRFLYRYADAAVYVVAWGETDADAVMAGFSALGGLRSKIVGTVLNKADPARSETYAYGYRGRSA